MKVPISWLKEYVEFEDTPQGLADRLTFSGIEVEGIEKVGGTVAGVVVGEVRTVDRHPNADRLTLCRVFDGTSEVQVVCGAPNVRAGAKIPFAPLGVTLPNGMKMKQAKIRGEESFGMLCAEDELGLSEDHTGVMILEDRWRAGTPLSEVLGPPDTVLDLEITPNRPDSLSLIGLAREVAALYGTTLKRPAIPARPAPSEDGPTVSVTVEDPAGCPRYTAQVLSHIQVGPSPDWMQKWLTLAGIRPINNVVDITNFVLLETGHPLHAFDCSLLEESHIVVRRARAGERLRTLDEMDRELSPDMLVIADATKPVAVAGIMGGAGSEINDDTHTVLLESACFDPLLVRSAARKLSLTTESSYRFERGVDPNGVELASQRAAALLMELAAAQPVGEGIDVYPAPLQPWPIRARWSFIRDLTGMAVDNERIREVLTSIELTLTDEDEDGFTALIPTFRRDLEREVDLVEEVARLHGLEHVPTPSPAARLVPDAQDIEAQAERQVKSQLAGLGFREIMNYSLTAPALLDRFDATDGATRVVLPHPISVDQSVLRPSLIPQMVETMGRNHARQIAETLFFEAGRVYWRREKGATAEEDRLALGLMGPAGRSTLDRRRPVEAEEIFFWLKGVVEALLTAQRVRGVTVQAEAQPGLEPNLSVVFRRGPKWIGRLGVLNAALRREWRMAEPVAVAEFRMAPFIGQFGKVGAVQAPPVYPAIERDVALLVPATLTHDEILTVIRDSAPPELEKVNLFDIFESDAVGSGQKSMAYCLTYRSLERTLTDAEANAYHDNVKDALRRLPQVSVREE